MDPGHLPKPGPVSARGIPAAGETWAGGWPRGQIAPCRTASAGRAGFDRPILHGLCTFGVACKAVLKTICDYDYTLIRQFDARFSVPVLPGDTITTDMWQDGDVVSFTCSVRERDAVVLRNGKCVLNT